MMGTENRAEHARINACGENVRPFNKQEGQSRESKKRVFINPAYYQYRFPAGEVSKE